MKLLSPAKTHNASRIQPQRHPRSQSGNVFFIILIGIALFGALAFSLTRSTQTSTVTKMSERELLLNIADIRSYGQRLKRAVDKVRRNGCSENDISFVNTIVTEYAHASTVSDKCQIFNTSGGSASWQTSPIENRQYEIWGSESVTGLGTADKSELILTLSLTGYANLCALYNEEHDLGSAIPNGTDDDNATRFTGTFTDAAPTILEFPGSLTGCYNENASGDYTLYMVLLER